MGRLLRRCAEAIAVLAVMALLPLGEAVGQTTVTMWTFLDPAKTTGREVALRQIIERFEKANPGIKVRVEPQIFSELMAKFLAGHNTGGAPDIIWVNTENMGALIGSGAAADLNPLFLGRWSKEQDADFFVRAGWDAGLSRGGRFAVPVFHATTSLFFRRDLLRQAGVDPGSIKTWEDLAQAAKKLTVDRDKDGRVDVWGYGTPLSTERTGGTTAFTVMMQAAGPVWEACKPRYTTEAGIRSVQYHADLITKHQVMPREIIANHVDDVADQFIAGRYAVAVMPFARFQQVHSQAKWDKNDLGILPWPNWTADRYGPQQVQGWWAAVWARSRRLQEAGKFLEFMINQESVRAWSTVGGQVPTRSSVYGDPEFRKPQYDYMKEVVNSWRAWSFMVPLDCKTSRFDADWNQAVHRVLVGGMTPKDAMAEAEKAFLSRQ